MNRLGQVSATVGIMICVMLFFATVSLIDPIKEGVSIARSDLECTSSTLSTGERSTCIVVDGFLPVFIGTCFAVALSAITYRKYQEWRGG